MSVRLSAQAEADLRQLIDWLAARSPKAARKAVMRVVLALDHLEAFAELAPEVDGAARQLRVRFGRDGFLIRYRNEEAGVFVESILHGRQDR